MRFFFQRIFSRENKSWIFKNFNKFLIAVLVLAFVLMSPTPPQAQAANLTVAKDYLYRQKASLTQGESHTVIFTPATAATGSTSTVSIVITFPDADDGLWCRTAGSLTTSSAVTAATDEGAVTALNTSWTAHCSIGSGASSYDKIIVNATGTLAATTKYGFFVSSTAGGAQLGTPAAAGQHVTTIATNNGDGGDGSTVDSQTIDLDIIAEDQVSVTATVDPYLLFTLTGTTIAFGQMTVGTVASGNVTSTLTLTTNSPNGYIISVRDQGDGTNGGLYKSSSPTDIMGSANSSYATTANLGSLSDNNGGYGIQATTSTTPSTCTNGQILSWYNQSSGGNTVGGLTVAGRTLVAATSTAVGPTDCTADVYYKAVAGSDTSAGSYSDTVTYIATGAF